MSGTPLAGQTDVLGRAANRFGISPEELRAYSGIPGMDVNTIFQTSALASLLGPNVTPEDSLRLQKEAIDYTAQKQLEQARERQKLGKESVAFASMYDQLRRLPGTIASAFGGAGERELMANLYGQIPSIVSETYRTFPRQQIQPVGYSMPSSQYFS